MVRLEVLANRSPLRRGQSLFHFRNTEGVSQSGSRGHQTLGLSCVSTVLFGIVSTLLTPRSGRGLDTVPPHSRREDSCRTLQISEGRPEVGVTST